MKYKILVINLLVFIIEYLLKLYIALYLISLFDETVITFFILLFILRLTLFRFYTIVNLIHYLIKFDDEMYSVIKFSPFTRLWYLDKLYLKGVVIIPVNCNLSIFICSTTYDATALEELKPFRRGRDIPYKLYYYLFSPFTDLHSISWKIDNNQLLRSSCQDVRVSIDIRHRLVASSLLKMKYEDGRIEYQKDYIDFGIV